ncbi:hypothetical protein GCM10027034_10790 [Ramlibacter solisilvae]|uniref:fused MFS/spermidine synthase n=1 Tax=Ramlibacter tataouinensis TaxID=94132 RepID=UPI000776E6AC|nr:fused MFS/spermidine synthase [Ramlibacter tataouinensis]
MHETQQPVARSRQVLALYAIFFVSGFCGLIYESIWSHYLKLLLGHAAYAQAVVLVVFVGGLALGAWLTGRWSERLRRPILLYAAAEALVGVFAFGFQRLFESASAWATASFLPAVCGEPGSCAASWLLAAALILPPSILLGTTFPLMSAGVIRLGVRPGRGLSLLYFLNSAGAALGVLGSGFLLIPALGLPGTMLLAGSMNLLVALAAFAAGSVGDAQAEPPAAQRPAAQASTRELRVLLLVAALTGLSSFVYEVVWIRMLTLVFGAATHSFELMLSAFILGLALGAWWIRKRIDTAPGVLRLLAAIQVLMGVLAVATLPLYAGLFDTMAFALRALRRAEEAYGLFNIAMGVMAAAVMLPATICAGMTLPLITAALLRGGHGERQVGQVYGVNTFGAIAGVLLAVHLLLPALGLKWSLATGAAIDVALGLLLWRLAGPGEKAVAPRRWVSPALAAGTACALLLAFPLATTLDTRVLASGVFRNGSPLVDRDSIIPFHRDGKTATVTVLESRNGTRSLLTNGKSDGASHPQGAVTTLDDATMVLLGALGPIHHPQARRAAVIGLGTGTSSAVLLESPRLEAVDTIEIEPMMVEAAQLFRPRNAKVFEDPRSRIIIDDARAHFAKARAHYDLIVSEPSNPWVSGVSGLFTTEFYRHAANHLAADGHFVQWLHLYEASPQVVGSIVRAFATVFPDFAAYTTNHADVVLVARRNGRPPAIDVAALDGMQGMRKRLLEIGIDSAASLAGHDGGPAAAIRILAQSYGAPPNSDYFPFVDNHAARARFLGATAAPLFALPEAPLPFLEFANGPAPHAGQVTIATATMPKALQKVAAGRNAMRYLQGRPVDAGDASWYADYAVDLALVRGWSQSCAVPAETGPAWQSVVRVASILNAGALPKDAQGFWSGMAQRCGSKLTPVQSAWLGLLAGVAARDAAATQERGLQVQAQDPSLTTPARSFAALATTSALLGRGDRARAAEVLAAQRAHLPESEIEQPWFRLLVMILSAQ